jgi:Lamin Tail Domain
MKRLLLLALLVWAGHTRAQLILNEVCYDPSNSGLQGDANGDGMYDQTQDEFIECVNAGTTPLDISRYRIYDRVLATGVLTLRHTVANGVVLPPGGAMVVFGGGAAIGTFGGAYVAVDVGTAGLSLGNSGESVLLADSSGNILDSLNTDALSDNPNESYTRSPDLTGPYVQHGAATPGVLFSPGTQTNGSPFTPYTGVGRLSERNRYAVFPNPGNGRIWVRGASPDWIRVLDVRGTEVYRGPYVTEGLDLQALPSGLYRLQVGESDPGQMLSIIR